MVVGHTIDGNRVPADLVDVLATNRLTGRAFTTMKIPALVGLKDTYTVGPPLPRVPCPTKSTFLSKRFLGVR